jgi:hypothetical protein
MCRSGSRPRPARWAARAGPHRYRGTNRCTRHGAHPGDRPAQTGLGVSGDHELSRLPAEALSKRLTGSPGHIGPPAFLFSWLRRGPGSHGLPEASPDLPAGSRGSGAGWAVHAPSQQPLDPTRTLITNADFFRMMPSDWGAPLRNRTVDLLLTIENQHRSGLYRRNQTYVISCDYVARCG